jgi:predicted DCC family thiol-disulfide oxidoreductase YuxK
MGDLPWPPVAWLLLAHTFVPRAPYGSWEGRARVDPAGNWRLPRAIFLVAWIALAAAYTYSGWTKLVSLPWGDGTAVGRALEDVAVRPGLLREVLPEAPPAILRPATWGVLVLELSFAPLALFGRLRPWLWTLTVLMHLGLMRVPGAFDPSMGMVVFHFFTFDPAWIAPKRAQAAEWLYYDGSCGLCHRTVRFVLAEDRSGDAFRFAPIGGDRFQASIPEAERRALPDSLVLRTADGRLLTRSAGVLHLLARLGGLWRVAAIALRALPTAARDAAYDLVAAIRYRLFARPTESCPLVPASLRERFDV